MPCRFLIFYPSHFAMISEQNTPSVLVLAAGMGSRYGGLKQVDPVGPNGETLMDYSLYDARKAGFTKVCFLIREEMHEIFHEQIGSKYADTMAVEYAYQSIDDLPAETNHSVQRKKPWGTGHAVWCARHVLSKSSFAVLNADDFYGFATFEELWRSLRQFKNVAQDDRKIRGFIVGYSLQETLSDHGSVSRGICKVEDGNLDSVEEWSGITSTEEGIIGTDSTGISHKLTGEEVVSMNVWGFPNQVFPALEEELIEFISSSTDLEKDEFYLPAAVDRWIKSGKAVFQTARASCKWMGVTYRDDKPVVVQSIGNMIASGEYPEALF